MEIEPAHPLSRRGFLAVAAALLGTARSWAGAEPGREPVEAVIDIHQHTNYSGRTDEQLIAHQRTMGITRTVLLPAGSEVNRPSTHQGKSNGLAAKCGGNQSVLGLARQHSREFLFGANEVTDLPEARAAMEKQLKLGAIIIAEQKFAVDCDSKEVEAVAALAREFRVPILLHFQHGAYNLGFERFPRVLKKFPEVNFIGHAQTWWGNIDARHQQEVLYPTGKVTPGGFTDRWLADYPNIYGDLSAGSGLNALLRDEEHTRAFLDRHQDKLLYGSDCNDPFGSGPKCQGAQTLAALRRLAPHPKALRKMLYGNAVRVLKLPA